MFTQKAKEKIEKILRAEKIVPTWKYGASHSPVYMREEQIQALLRDGMIGYGIIEESYRSQDALAMPEEHYAIFEEMKTELLYSKLFPRLEESDFSKTCNAFWDLYAEHSIFDDAIAELEFDIRSWVSENIGFNIEPNLDTLIGNHAESVEMAMDALSWSALQEIRIKGNPANWLFVTLYDILKEHDEATSFAKEFNNLGQANELLISSKSWERYSAQHISHTVHVALNLKRYLEEYPEGISAESHCVRVELDSGRVLHVALEKDIPFLSTLAASQDSICHTVLQGIKEIGIAPKEKLDMIEPAPMHSRERIEKIIMGSVCDFVQQKLDEEKYDYMDLDKRSLIHYIYASGDSGMMTRWVRAVREKGEDELKRMGDRFFGADRFGVSVLTLCKAIENQFSNLVLSTLCNTVLHYLPEKNATASLWEVKPKHLVTSKQEGYFLLEYCNKAPQDHSPLDMEFLLLHKDSNKFMRKKMRDLDGIYTVYDISVYLDGKWHDHSPF